MKVEINEYEGCYHIELTPETLPDVNTLLRLKMNAKKDSCSVDTYASRTSGAATSVIINRTKNDRSWIK